MKIISAIVDGKHTINLDKDNLPHLDILPIDETLYNVIVGSKSLKVEITDRDYITKSYKVKVENKVFKVQLNSTLDVLIEDMGLATEQFKEVNEIKAPMPGLLLKIMVEKGVEVHEDEPLLILEAMKMENVILSPKKGIIKNISVKEGETVEKSDLLIEFE